jgi:hypothetical protein
LTTLAARVAEQRASLLLMMAEEAGGLEFDHVLLTPELMTTNRFKDAYAFDARICAVYIALSRARRQLYLPYDVEEWITTTRASRSANCTAIEGSLARRSARLPWLADTFIKRWKVGHCR